MGVWSSGLWVKFSSTADWEQYATAIPNDIASGPFRTASWGAAAKKYPEPQGGFVSEPGSDGFIDRSDEGPGGENFVYQETDNMIPQESEGMKAMRIPGPGEPGFTFTEQKNLFPQARLKENNTKK
jgi:hypothetical protein